jgi:hypothetical protein
MFPFINKLSMGGILFFILSEQNVTKADPTLHTPTWRRN